MDDYIIDPSWFYWIDVITAAKTVFTVLMILTVILLVCSICWAAASFEYGPDDKDYIMAKKAVRVITPIAIVMIAACVFIPSKETLIEMQIARMATKENVGLTVDAIKNAVDYIVNVVKSIGQEG